MSRDVKLPELGENIESVEVASVLVSEGDSVDPDQPLIEVETEKASMEIPSPAGGTISKVHVRAGDTVRVGQTLVTLDGVGRESAAGPPPAEAEAEPTPEPVEAEPTPEHVVAAAAAVKREPSPKPEEATREPATSGGAESPESPLADPIAAAPSVRRLARELGLDLRQVRGSGPAGRISADDVKEHTRGIVQGMGRVVPAIPGQPARFSLPDLAAYGDVTREPIQRVRRVTAENMARSWAVVPHVTQHDRADVTDLETFRKRYAEKVAAAGGKLTVTAILLKVVAGALREFPKFNAGLDLEAGEVVFREYVHVGVAVDTERGLLVPVVRNADRKGITDIAVEVSDLASRARSKKLKPDEMRGAGFTVSNLGGLGTTEFSPIVNWPESAILGVGRATTEAVWREDGFEPRLILPLSLSYDHRLIDGAEAARFLRWLAEAMEQPMLLALGSRS